MVCKLELIQSHGCVRLNLEGPVTQTELEKVLDAVYATLERNRCDKIILDVMRIDETVSMTGMYAFFVFLSGERIKKDLRIAVLARQEQLRVIRIIQDLEKDRGIQFRGFPDQDAAFTWLWGHSA